MLLPETDDAPDVRPTLTADGYLATSRVTLHAVSTGDGRVTVEVRDWKETIGRFSGDADTAAYYVATWMRGVMSTRRCSIEAES